MLLAESAVFACFHSVWMKLLILLCIVVTVLAFCASKCNSCTHFQSLRVISINNVFTHPDLCVTCILQHKNKSLMLPRSINIPYLSLFVNRFLLEKSVKKRYSYVDTWIIIQLSGIYINPRGQHE